MAELLGVSERTVRRYLPEEFKETETARGVPVPPPRAKEEPSGAKYSLERKRTALALQKHFPEQAKEIREILRSEKPYLRSKDDIDRYWELVRKSREDPFTVFTKHFYLYDGPTGLGYRPALPYWIKIGLEEVAKEKAKEGGEATSPDALATQVLADYITQQGIERERLVEAAKEHLRKEWLLDVELDS
ncbi:MAG: hypothetical protein DRI61_03270 [Chloroflexi bacterium]|nr:MAG: hypothetical protein DRI61_03270 [Chloroflexota bacterium]